MDGNKGISSKSVVTPSQSVEPPVTPESAATDAAGRSVSTAEQSWNQHQWGESAAVSR